MAKERINVNPLSEQDAVFLPGITHGCEWQACILYYNPQADNGNGCFEIEYVDKDGILALYKEVDGDAEAFFGTLPDLYHGKWYYCNRTSENFKEYESLYPLADFICGVDGGIEDEMNFLYNWAKS